MCIFLVANNPPVIVGPPTLLVTLGEEAELVFTVIDDNNLFKVFVVGGLPVNSTLTFTPHNGFTSFTLRWTIFEIVDVSLMFEARDERSAVSVLSVQVQICACQNGGECTLNGLLSSSDRTVVLNCNCPEGDVYNRFFLIVTHSWQELSILYFDMSNCLWKNFICK